ncbi:type II and III secretion system protein family protein [Fulvimarina endophytica]|uniref:Type II and III secretion system protein family protein n=1 Tax=Fulvimarina endophytica TaxID=2293836 RepID=A0A371X8G2_9HYPH|nr:type II and III secretion system protein family protein [Fulvimarina endophytica]RFC65481.1 type II and III secretion system protein family protein [Fulvimarina endophytica]
MTISAFLRTLCISAALAGAVVGTPLPAMADENYVPVGMGNTTIQLGLDKSKVIELSADAHDILVANPSVADALTRDKRHIYLFGKQVGQTNLIVFDKANRQIASIEIRIERDVTGLAAAIRRYVPDSDVTVEIMNDNVVLTGRVRTPLDAKRVGQIAGAYLTGGEATTGNYIRQASAGGEANGGADVAFASESRRESQIINLLQIEGEDQVTLKVTVAEVQRSVVKQLGLDGAVSTAIDGVTFGAVTDNVFGLGNALGGQFAGLGYNNGSTDVSTQLRAMEQAGVMRTLAEPSLTAISGESASFKVGGEFSVPSGRDFTPEKRTNIRDANGRVVDVEIEDGQYTLNSRNVEYGIGLDFTPVVLSPGRISLKLRTSVSEPTFESPFNLGSDQKSRIPATAVIGIRKRLADTTVELPSGGSLVIAGLVRDEVRQVISGFPGLSKLPILGSLFRSRDFQRYETELVIIVTPYLVRPVAREALARPDDGLAFSSDGAGNFLGRINRIYGHSETQLPPGRYHGVVGYIYK